MEHALLPQRQSLSDHRQTSSKRAADYTSPSKKEASQVQDENEEIAKDCSTNGSHSKRMKESTVTHTPSPLRARTSSNRDDHFSSTTRHYEADNSSDTASSTTWNIENESTSPSCHGASVKKLKGWLSDFEQQQKAHFQKNNVAGNAKLDGSLVGKNKSAPSVWSGSTLSNQTNILAPSTSTSCSYNNSTTPVKASARPASRPVPRPSSTASPATTSHVPTPVRYRFAPKIKQEEVEATNNMHASVGKLSAWLADDPFQKQKEFRGGRRGAKVVSKARAFEPLPQNDAVRTVAGSKAANVSDRKQWLQNAFTCKKNGEEETLTVADRAKWLQTAFKPKNPSRSHCSDYGASGDHAITSGASDGSCDYAESCERNNEEGSKQGDCAVVENYGISNDKRVPPGTGIVVNVENPPLCLDASMVSNSGIENSSVESTFTSSSPTAGKRILKGGVMQASETFGGAVNSASVQSRKDAFEWKEQKAKKKADSRSSMLKTKWEADEASHTFKKKMVDAHVPRKKLSDLP